MTMPGHVPRPSRPDDDTTAGIRNRSALPARRGRAEDSAILIRVDPRNPRQIFLEKIMLLEGHFQNAYVTRDLDKAVALFRSHYGVDKVLQFQSQVEVKTPAGTGAAVFKTAFAWVGSLQYEFIEPVSGLVQVYQQALPPGDGLAFHHVCMRVQDWEGTRAEIDGGSYPIVLEGETAGVRFVYVDARESLGHYLEYVWMKPEVWSAMGGR